MKRVPELDGLRGIAILLVVICHFVDLGFPANNSINTIGYYG